MPWFQEATFHDRQAMASMGNQTVTAAQGFVNVVGATLTTKDLSQPSTYTGFTSVLLSGSNNNSVASFRLLINGSPIDGAADIILKVKDLDVGYTLMTVLQGLVKDDVLQLQFAIDSGTLTLAEFTILLDGVPGSRVVI